MHNNAPKTNIKRLGDALKGTGAGVFNAAVSEISNVGV